MSQRLQKVESLVGQTVARELLNSLDADGALVTVTRVVVTPDLHQATIWVAVLATATEQERIFERLVGIRSEIQGEVARTLTTKFTPRLEFRLDTGGEYAERISRLLRQT